MEKTIDVVALGELLIDFTENGISPQGNPLLEANPGGAPCNVLAMLNNLGKKTAFIGKVGNDSFGHMLASVVAESGTDVSNLLFDDEVGTTLAFVHTLPDGDREFSFYRNPGADMCLGASDVDAELIKSSRVFHFGTLSSTHEKVREATRFALSVAKENGLLISFDPNLREPLWESLKHAKEEIAYGLSQCDILKISDNEMVFMTGTDDYDAGVKMLQEKYNIPLICVTLGKDGSKAYCNGHTVFEPGVVTDKTIETTGAGDTFGACVISYALDNGIENLDEAKLHEMLRFANKAASIITTRKGALRVMPKVDEIENILF